MKTLDRRVAGIDVHRGMSSQRTDSTTFEQNIGDWPVNLLDLGHVSRASLEMVHRSPQLLAGHILA
jgi:hypothetical protein